MKHIKKFNEAWDGKVWNIEDIYLVKLIDNDGNVLDKNGHAEEGVGVFDTEGYDNYMGGVSEDNTLVVNQEIAKKVIPVVLTSVGGILVKIINQDK